MPHRIGITEQKARVTFIKQENKNKRLGACSLTHSFGHRFFTAKSSAKFVSCREQGGVLTAFCSFCVPK